MSPRNCSHGLAHPNLSPLGGRLTRMQQIVYEPADRPLCEVHHDGTWVPGEVRMWTHHPDGWVANVGYTLSGAMNYIKNVPDSLVRPVRPPC